jgi:hypothetical protein
MSSPSLELQGAIVSRLKSVTAVTSIVEQRIYDYVPRAQDGGIMAEFPFVAIASSDEVTEEADCIDGSIISIDLDCWSRDVGFPEVRRIAAAVRSALHNHDFNLAANAVVYFQHRQTRTLRDPDGLTSHAILTFEAFAELPS